MRSPLVQDSRGAMGSGGPFHVPRPDLLRHYVRPVFGDDANLVQRHGNNGWKDGTLR